MHLGYRLALATLVLVTFAGQGCANHHECDVDSYGSHCAGGERVTCEDRTQGEPCVSDQGCDTYVTTTACGAATACVVDNASRAVCQGTLAPAACNLAATAQLPPIGVSSIVPDAIAADINGDGHPDIITFVPTHFVVSLGNGDGTFRALPVQNFDVRGDGGVEEEGVDGLAVGDFNGDKHVDLAYVDFRPDPVIIVLLGAGDGTFHEGAATPACINDPAVADLDGDGIDDLVDGTNVLFGTANGGFRSLHPTTSSAGGCFPTLAAGRTAVADFDGDGRPDVAGVPQVFDYDASGAANPILDPLDATTTWLAAGDADGDHVADLIMMTSSGLAFRHGRKGTSLDNPVPLAAAPYAPTRVAFADVNGDGQLDVVASDPAADVVLIWKNLGNATFSPSATVLDPIHDAADLAAVTDFDHDGRADFLLRANRTIGVVHDGCGAL